MNMIRPHNYNYYDHQVRLIQVLTVHFTICELGNKRRH